MNNITIYEGMKLMKTGRMNVKRSGWSQEGDGLKKTAIIRKASAGL